MYSIDLNSDMGESFGAYKLGGDEEIIMWHADGTPAILWSWIR